MHPAALVRLGLLSFTVILFGLLVVDIAWLQIALVVVSGLIAGVNNALFTSLVMELSPYARGITSGVYNFVRWLGAAIAPLLSGVIGASLSPHAPYGVAALMALVGVWIMSVNHAQKKRQITQSQMGQ
ncbi:MFS transporter [Brevibacillus humidisoli]|uniref:MFS transporter n=1 Tax=Brevibacillus humidisoli TaxID=2895522 RepID=UPI001E35B89E|nr:MFS transporter [Brevibacillus humidisoli]UFJ42596.1 MFS transporter [Brevibacillus humidisoli]